MIGDVIFVLFCFVSLYDPIDVRDNKLNLKLTYANNDIILVCMVCIYSNGKAKNGKITILNALQTSLQHKIGQRFEEDRM